MIVTATAKELTLIEAINEPVLITGEGAGNLVQALSRIPKWTPIFNIGYAGSNVFPVGTRCNIGKVRFYHPNANIHEKIYDLGGDVLCYTAGDFITKTDIVEPCVFDMELALICALGFENVRSVKVVSDNLSKKQYVEAMRKSR